MKKLFISLLSLLILTSALYFIGCGDDDNPTGNDGLKPGNVDNPNFQLMSTMLSPGTLQLNMIYIDMAGELLDSIQEGPGKAYFAPDSSEFESISFSYTYDNFWHIFQCTVHVFGGDDDLDSAFFTGVDSVRFEGPEGPMQWPNDLTNMSRIRYHFDVDAYALEGLINVSNDGSFDLSSIIGGNGDFTINGSTLDTIITIIDIPDTTVDLAMVTQQEFIDLMIDSLVQADESCSPGGEVNVDVRMDLDITIVDQGQQQQLGVHGNWVADFEFHPDRTVTAYYSDGTYEWTVTEDCSGGGTAKLYVDQIGEILNR